MEIEWERERARKLHSPVVCTCHILPRSLCLEELPLPDCGQSIRLNFFDQRPQSKWSRLAWTQSWERWVFRMLSSLVGYWDHEFGHRNVLPKCLVL